MFMQILSSIKIEQIETQTNPPPMEPINTNSDK